MCLAKVAHKMHGILLHNYNRKKKCRHKAPPVSHLPQVDSRVFEQLRIRVPHLGLASLNGAINRKNKSVAITLL